jgi:hypothetical protein
LGSHAQLRERVPKRVCGRKFTVRADLILDGWLKSLDYVPNRPLNPPFWGTLKPIRGSEVPQIRGFRGRV